MSIMLEYMFWYNKIGTITNLEYIEYTRTKKFGRVLFVALTVFLITIECACERNR